MASPIIKVEKIKNCLQCNEQFSYVRASMKYCSTSCKLKHHRKNNSITKPRKRKSKFQHFASSLPGGFFLRNIRRVGTVQIVPQDITVDEIAEIAEVHRQGVIANGTGIYKLPKSEQYEYCHLSPVDGENGSIGLLIAANLVIAPGSVNKELGSKTTIYSTLPYLSVQSSELKNKWKIKKGMTAVDIIKLLDKWLGGTLGEFQDIYKLKAYVAPKEGGKWKGTFPQSPMEVMKWSLEHIQKHHELLFKPTYGNSYDGDDSWYSPDDVEYIIPSEIAPVDYKVSYAYSYRYLLTGEFDEETARNSVVAVTVQPTTSANDAWSSDAWGSDDWGSVA